MLNVKKRLPARAAFKFLFRFPEVIRVEFVPDDPPPVSQAAIRVPVFVNVLRG
jgi:hypothetical protein